MIGKLKKLWRRGALQRILRTSSKRGDRRVLIVWNRGLGDIALGLCALVHEISQHLPRASITFLTRPDLQEGFLLLESVQTLVAPHWKRGEPIDLDRTLRDLGVAKESFDLILEKPDPTLWCRWQLGSFTPRLAWKAEWDILAEKFGLRSSDSYVGMQVQTETSYGYNKNWPLEKWRELIAKITTEAQLPVVLFGHKKEPFIDVPGVVDLRGETSLLEMLALIKNRCRYLVLPDSGILSLSYYLPSASSLHIVSLWADPCQGVLKQAVASPNPALTHSPLIAEQQRLDCIAVNDVVKALL